MSNCLFTSLTEVIVLTHTTFVSHSNNGVHITAIASSSWMDWQIWMFISLFGLLRLVFRNFSLNQIFKNIIWDGVNFFGNNFFPSFDWEISKWMLLSLSLKIFFLLLFFIWRNLRRWFGSFIFVGRQSPKENLF